jgi:hypothetical protein
MTHRIQKYIILKFIQLVDKGTISEEDLNPLLKEIQGLLKSKKLIQSDIYRQKIELVTAVLSDCLESIKRKRNSKEIALSIPNDIVNLLKSDIEGLDLGSLDRIDLEKLEPEGGVQISFDNVYSVLDNLIIPKRKLTVEADLERFICIELAQIFGKEQIHNQYSVGGFLALKTDIDVGNGQVGIELKISDHLAATDMQRLIGQAIYYKKRFYKNNLIVLIASRSSINSTTKELKEFIEELGITVLFKQALI